MKSIAVKKHKNGNITVTPGGCMASDDLYHHDDLFFADMQFATFGTEWIYLVDYSTGLVYPVTDYGYNHINDLLEGKAVKLVPCGKVGTDEYPEEDV